MFTGLVEETGEVVAMEKTPGGARLHIATPESFLGLALGESIAINGCCLTLVSSAQETLSFDLLDETLIRTNLGFLPIGAMVNLERALPVNGRLGGHFVQGHVDCVSEILAFQTVGFDRRLEIALPPVSAQYIIFKGSVAIDGISLTVAEVLEDRFVVWIIPHTLAATNLEGRSEGEQVNLEFDLLAKYIERLVNVRDQRERKLHNVFG